jgi:hypothetical protein
VSLGLLAIAGCSPTRQLHRYFLTKCPADGPVPEAEMGIHLEPVASDTYYASLEAFSEAVPVRTVAQVGAGGRPLPIYQLGPIGSIGGRRVLVVAGIHGNEIAGALAAPRLLADVRDRPADYAGVEISLIAPANPVGLLHLSRYNGAGCDVNRDFGPFATVEAAAIRDALDALRPELVVSLHEGPQDGFFVIATRAVPAGVAEAMADGVRAAGFPLASRSFLRLPLGTPGLEREGWLTTQLKRVIRLHSLGAFAEERSIGTLTTESPWSSPDVEARVGSQVAAVRALARRLREASEAP